jgi:hypothetical protein
LFLVLGFFRRRHFACFLGYAAVVLKHSFVFYF